MIDTIPIFESKSEGIFSFVLLLFKRVTLPSYIKSQLVTFEKTTYTLSPKRVVIPIKNDVNGFRNFILSHNETSTAKIDHKNEINAKKWVGSNWVAKSQLKKSMPVKKTTPGQGGKKVNAGQRSKSTSFHCQSQPWSTADVAGLTWR
jgi:hypothetical protein